MSAYNYNKKFRQVVNMSVSEGFMEAVDFLAMEGLTEREVLAEILMVVESYRHDRSKDHCRSKVIGEINGYYAELINKTLK